jgi:tripartite-type tricarboxylate transporter receptor subunit TctC
MRNFRLIQQLLIAAIATFLMAAAGAQTFPGKPIRFIVPYPPGGGNDDVARLIARKVSENTGATFIVENKAGASGMLAGEYVARAPADGYTIMIDHSGIAINPALFPAMKFDVLKDLAPVVFAVTQSSMLIAHPSLPANSVAELIALAKAQPGKLNWASPGNGSPQHIGMEQFTRMAGLRIAHIPYKGGAPATNALLSGEVHLLISGTTGLPAVKAGKAKLLATTGPVRSAALPGTPTVDESGLKGYELMNWQGIFAPAQTPAPAILWLNTEIARALKSPDVTQVLREKNYEVVAGSADALGKELRQSVAQYAKIVKEAGILPD